MSTASTTVDAGTAQRAKVRLALLALFGGAVVIAFSGIFVRWSETGPIATGFYRMGFAGVALLLLPFLVPRFSVSLKAATALSMRDKMLLAAGGALFALDLAVWHPALLMTTISNATFIGNMSTLFVVLGAWLIFKRRIGRVFVFGLFVTFIGAALLMGVSFGIDRTRLMGDALSLLAAVFYGGYFLIVAELRKRLPTGTVITWTCLAAAVALLPIAVLHGDAMLPATAAGWLPLLGIGLVVHLGGHGAIAFAFKHLSPQFAAVGTYLQPVASAILAWILIGERLGWGDIAGSALILAGIWIAHKGAQRDAARERR